jgi:hypothetical protein
MTLEMALTVSRSATSYSQDTLWTAWLRLDEEPQTREIISARGRCWGQMYRIFN